MTYQTFPGEENGHSNSIAKLQALGFPPRFDRLSFLDIGCNEGFFCFEAKRRGAAASVGVDTYAPFIEKARDRAAKYQLDVSFHTGNVHDIEGKFDYILVASVLHYIKDPILFFRKVWGLLKPGGKLLLELGICESTNDLTKVFRDDTSYVYPSLNFLTSNWLRDFDAVVVGQSINQPGDPVPRWVLHCSKNQSIYLSPPSGAALATFSKTESQTINADQFFLPATPRSLAKVPEVQRKIFEAGAKFNCDAVLAYKSLSNDPTVVEYVVDLLDEAIRFQGGSKHTFVTGQIVPYLSDALYSRLNNPAHGLKVYRISATDWDGRPGKTSAVDVQSIEEVKSDIARIGHKGWIERFLLQNRAPNRALLEHVSKDTTIWHGPVDLPIGTLIERAGPGKLYHEDQELWDKRAEEIASSIKDPNDWPPVIAYYQSLEDGTRSIVLADGSHRYEAYKRSGFSTVPTLIWFDSQRLYQDYLSNLG